MRAQKPWERLSDSVCCVLGGNKNPYTINGTNCYLIGKGQVRILVDCAERYYGHATFMKNLRACCEATGCTGISAIVITHLHHDHYGGIYAVQESYGPNIPVYKSEVPDHWWGLVESVKRHGQLDRFVKPDGTLRFHPKRDIKRRSLNGSTLSALAQRESTVVAAESPPRLDTRDFDWLQSELGFDDSQRRELPFVFALMYEAYIFYQKLRSGELPWRKLREGTILRDPSGTVTLRCHCTPGHSSDHCAFFLVEERRLISGDCVLGQGTTVVFDMFDYMHSLETMLSLRPESLYPGHGPFVRDGVAHLQRYVRHRRAREVQVWRALCEASSEKALTSRHVAEILYASTNSKKIDLASQNVLKILVGLHREGFVRAYVRLRDREKLRWTPRDVSRQNSEWIELDPADVGTYDRHQSRFVDAIFWDAKDNEASMSVIKRRELSLLKGASL